MTDKKYIYLENFLDPKELEILFEYSVFSHKRNITTFDVKQTMLGETMQWGGWLYEMFLEKKRPLVEKAVGKELFPTYSFHRFYNKFSKLQPHTDREAYEISVSISLGQDKEWPLNVGGDDVIIKPGDGLIYFGTKYEHSREEYLGDYASQVFFHYVDKNGEFAHWKYDQRPDLGNPFVPHPQKLSE